MEHNEGCLKKSKSFPCCEDQMCPCDRDAFEFLIAENARYRKALEFYAKKTLDRSDDVEWLESDEYKECYNYFTGRRAREALKGGEW